MNLAVLNRTAAVVAAAALYELFPGIELLENRGTSVTFSYDFHSSMPIPSDAEILIEERMRQIVREKRPIRVLEMVSASARGLLLKEGHKVRASQLEEDRIVQIVQVGSFHDLGGARAYLSDTSQIAAFKLHPLQSIDQKVFRLSGSSFPSKGELNQFLKAYSAYPLKSHASLGEKKSLWTLWEDQIVWLTAGLKKRRELIEHLRSQLFFDATEVSFPIAQPRLLLHAAFAAKNCSIAEIYWEPSPSWDPEIGFFAGEGGTRVLVSFFVPREDLREKLISSLQRIGKTLNILGFQHRLCLFGRRRSEKGAQVFLEALKALGAEAEIECEETAATRLEFLVKDLLGREWAAFSVELSTKGFFVTSSVERLVAFLIERTIV